MGAEKWDRAGPSVPIIQLPKLSVYVASWDAFPIILSLRGCWLIQVF